MSDFNVESERTFRRHGLIYRIRRVYDDTGQPDPIADGEFVKDETYDTIPVPEDVLRKITAHTRILLDHLKHYRNRHLPLDTGEELRYAREDLQRLANYYLDEWHYLGVLVEIFLLATAAKSLGARLAESSVWGIESDSDEPFFPRWSKSKSRRLRRSRGMRPPKLTEFRSSSPTGWHRVANRDGSTLAYVPDRTTARSVMLAAEANLDDLRALVRRPHARVSPRHRTGRQSC